jgi:hypothetical protein
LLRARGPGIALDAVLLAAAVCIGAALYTFFGAGAAWLFAGLALLLAWWALGRTD